jgi:hypothetical protein
LVVAGLPVVFLVALLELSFRKEEEDEIPNFTQPQQPQGSKDQFIKT